MKMNTDVPIIMEWYVLSVTLSVARSLPHSGQYVACGWSSSGATQWRLEIVIDEKKIVSTCVGAIWNALIWSRHWHLVATMAAARRNSSKVRAASKLSNNLYTWRGDEQFRDSKSFNYCLHIDCGLCDGCSVNEKRFAEHYFNEEQDQRRTSQSPVFCTCTSEWRPTDDATVCHLWIGNFFAMSPVALIALCFY